MSSSSGDGGRARERDEPWYVAAFRGEYLAVYPHRNLESARVEARWILERGVHGRVLDHCCGFARHTLALRELGVDVFGMDLSPDLLRHARALPGSERLAGRLVRGDARRLPFRDATFDSLVNLFSSFGYFGDEGDRAVLDEIARVLRPSGTIVLDLMNPARIRAGLVPRSRAERGGFEWIEERSLADDDRRVVKRVTKVAPSGERQTWTESVRMYELDEMEALLAARGLRIEGVDGGFEGEAAGPAAPRQILRARRAGTSL